MMMVCQLAIPGLDMHIGHHATRVGLGRAGELLARQFLIQAGYRVVVSPYGEPGDLRVHHPRTGEITIVEVKTARRCKDRKWRFTLRLNNHTNHLRSDVVILLAVTDLHRVIPFVIPVAALVNQRQAVITSHPETYRGKLAQFRQRIESLDLCFGNESSNPHFLGLTNIPLFDMIKMYNIEGNLTAAGGG